MLGVLRRLLPERLALALLEELDLVGARLDQLRREDRLRLVEALTPYRLPWSGHEGYRVAEVTGGGVALSQVNAATLESRIAPGLYICGEMLDAFGPIGGYNFLWAWVTGKIAGLAAGATICSGPLRRMIPNGKSDDFGRGLMGTAVAWPLVDNGHEVRLVGTHLDAAIIRSCLDRGWHPKLKRQLPDGIMPYYVERAPEGAGGRGPDRQRRQLPGRPLDRAHARAAAVARRAGDRGNEGPGSGRRGRPAHPARPAP